MCSHAYALAGRAEPARYHAERCMAIVEANGIADFDLVYANEAMARSLALAGAMDEAGRYLERPHATPIADDEDRSIVEADLAAEPWYRPQRVPERPPGQRQPGLGATASRRSRALLGHVPAGDVVEAIVVGEHLDDREAAPCPAGA